MIFDEKNPQTRWKEEYQADGRDFLIENTIGELTPEVAAELPDSINLLDGLARTYNQGSLGACTAYALTHIQLYQNCKEFESDLVELDPLGLWKNMGHDPSNKDDSGDYLENALKASVDKGIPGKGPSGKSMTFSTNNYAFKSFGLLNQNDIDNIKRLLYQGHPLYTAIKGTSKTRRELVVGELVTVYSPSETTGGHAVAIFGIDEDYIYFANSRAPMQGQRISTFKISINTMRNMLRQNMCSWRYRAVYDKKDIVTPCLFEDYYKDATTEEYQAVKFLKDNGIVKGSNGKLKPNEPITREQMCLLLYRMLQTLSKTNTKKATT